MILISIDAVLLPLSLWASFSLRLGEFYVPDEKTALLIAAGPVIAIPIFIRFGLYRAVIRYIGLLAMWTTVKSVTLYTLVWGVLVLMSGIAGVPRSILLINWFVTLLLIGSTRALARWWLEGDLNLTTRKLKKTGVIIYGAGDAGAQIATALKNSPNYRPLAFIDDNPALQGHIIAGLRIHAFSHLAPLILRHSVRDVLLAMPSLSRAERNQIIARLEPFSVHVTTLPVLDDIASGKLKVDDVKEVGVRDLLGRDPVKPDLKLLHANVKDKVVMVTGAGGSIGSELCRQILQVSPAVLILYERSEPDLYQIDRELNETISASTEKSGIRDVVIAPILASILNSERLQSVCESFGVQTIYHAAAYKHVPMVERNPSEAILNNIIGTYKTAFAAVKNNVETFVLVSTDKAVRPTSTMGATKRFSEMILQGMSSKPGMQTRFSIVRFGNVIDSSGSVVPLFRQQIARGGPVTVTDPEVTRYFMTIPEAAQLVIQAGAMGGGGEVFVLDMGQPVRILELAKRLIRLSGLQIKSEDYPEGDIEITFTGLRPGEKLYEELLIGENVSTTGHQLIMAADEEFLKHEEIKQYLIRLEHAAETNQVEKCRIILLEAVKNFTPQCGVKDLVYQQQNGKRIPISEIEQERIQSGSDV